MRNNIHMYYKGLNLIRVIETNVLRMQGRCFNCISAYQCLVALPHQSYSPDLIICDYFLFTNVTNHKHCREFESRYKLSIAARVSVTCEFEVLHDYIDHPSYIDKTRTILTSCLQFGHHSFREDIQPALLQLQLMVNQRMDMVFMYTMCPFHFNYNISNKGIDTISWSFIILVKPCCYCC